MDPDEQPDDTALAEDLAYVKAVFDGLAEAVVRFGRPMPATVARARGILDRALSSAMSLERQEIGPDEGELNSEHIGSDQVAELLGVTRRTVQRNAKRLGGQRVSGNWVFDPNDLGVDDVAS
jgi:hypothetical protein